MSDQHFLRCNCQRCGESIEFPAHGAGLEIACPHCGQKTLLSEPAPLVLHSPLPPSLSPETELASTNSDLEPQRATKSRLLAGVLVLVALSAIGAGAWYFLAGPGAKKPESTVALKSAKPVAKPPEPAIGNPVPTTPANPTSGPPAAEQVESSNSIESVQKPAKSIDDLKPGPVSLEKAKAGSLIHAVGLIKNGSDQQRFGVRVEIELTDARGHPAGKASDYTQVIEPRQEWRFRALVVDPRGSKAIAAKVSSITEDN